jgi:hypothetical protein
MKHPPISSFFPPPSPFCYCIFGRFSGSGVQCPETPKEPFGKKSMSKMCYKIKTNSMSLFFVILLLRFLDVSMHGEFIRRKPIKNHKREAPIYLRWLFSSSFSAPLEATPKREREPSDLFAKAFRHALCKKAFGSVFELSSLRTAEQKHPKLR